MNFIEYKIITIMILEHLRKNGHIQINDTRLMIKLNLAIRNYYNQYRLEIVKLK